MAEERKPKIDLKARLGKTGMPPQMAPATNAAAPMQGVPAARPSYPAPAYPGGATASSAPAPMAAPGIPVGATPFAPPSAASAYDGGNPLSAVAVPYRPQTAPPPAAQRIEVDEVAVDQARRGARNRTLVVGLVISGVTLVLGFVVGRAAGDGAQREKSVVDAKQLKDDLVKARVTLTTLSDKLEAGRNRLMKERKFPDALAKDLGELNVAFDGTELQGRHFNSFRQETSSALVDFVTSVQALNDRRELVQGLLQRLQKPLTDQLNAPQGHQTVSYVVVVDKDPGGNPSAMLASLATPISFTPPKIDIPTEFTFTNPMGSGSGNSKLPAYKGGDIAKNPAAMYVVPKTFDKICPNETSGQSAQLAAQIGGILREIKGEGQAGADVVSDAKPGLLERADKLMASLDKVGQ